MFNLNKYEQGQFNLGDFTNFAQLVGIQMMQQYTNCGMNNYLVKLDQTFNELPQIVGGASNIIT